MDDRTSSPREIFLVALRLGCLSFGGPVAHLGYFRAEYVERRRWLDDARFADIVALCQFLPGPASSQVGFAIGRLRGGLAGGLAAWLGFTLPSAALMIAFALGVTALGDLSGAGWLAGLKVTAVAVVAKAVRDLHGRLCPDGLRTAMALVAAALLLLAPGPWAQVLVIAGGAVLGALVLGGRVDAATPAPAAEAAPRGGRGLAWLAAFALLLAGLPLLARDTAAPTLQLVDTFYRAGSLVFGGGHVVLPLLETSVVRGGWLDADTFLAGYGAAQALPGPLFTFSAFLGAAAGRGPGGVGGGLVALLAVFLPSWLLVLGVLPWWERLRGRAGVRAALAGTNAAVVGLLLAALYQPVWTAAIHGPRSMAVLLLAGGLLLVARWPPWLVVLASALAGQLLLGGGPAG